ncbi:MAG: DUF3750 domain-containing protein [Phycisphaerales bacterium]|nr:MAG: DUF3750 domain-containing protein [Phycisphaerales bacterium]
MRPGHIVRFAARFVMPCIIAGCRSDLYFPDQEQFAPLDALAYSDLAVARIYAASFPFTEGIATHPWFVVKPANSSRFERWEVGFWTGEPYGFVHKDLFPLEHDVGIAGPRILAELLGAEAESVVDFIRHESPNYPCKDFYVLLPGPNSNTYLQWVLDNTGWQVDLPPTAVGANATVHCP